VDSQYDSLGIIFRASDELVASWIVFTKMCGDAGILMFALMKFLIFSGQVCSVIAPISQFVIQRQAQKGTGENYYFSLVTE
jgi:hypothetical protein